jgi:hypothetical protein
MVHLSQEEHLMPASLSLDIRHRFQRCIEDGPGGSLPPM